MDNKKLILIILLCILGISNILIYNNKINNKNLFDEKIEKETNNNNGGFAIMLEREDGKGYIKSEDNNWPSSGYVFNNKLSGCLDTNGEIIENSLTYDENEKKAIINTRVATACYLYFDLTTAETQLTN